MASKNLMEWPLLEDDERCCRVCAREKATHFEITFLYEREDGGFDAEARYPLCLRCWYIGVVGKRIYDASYGRHYGGRGEVDDMVWEVVKEQAKVVKRALRAGVNTWNMLGPYGLERHLLSR